MKALVVRAYGAPDSFAIEDLPIPEPGPGQLQVRVTAASLNPADLLMTAGTFREMASLDFPFVPGIDVAGTVTMLGPGTEGFEVGDDVFGFGMPPSFASGMGIPAVTSGALAEYAVFQAGPYLAKRPPKLNAAVAAALPSTGMTGLAVLNLGRFQPGETVLVIGAPGGVGSVVVPLLDEQVTVIATGTAEDEEYVRGMGAAEMIDYLETDLVEEVLHRHPQGVDAVVNLALTSEDVITATRALRPGGRLLSTTPGTPSHPAVTTVMGASELKSDTMATIAAHALDGTLPDRVTRTYPLSDAVRAYRDLAGSHTRGKRVVIVDAEAAR
ncbi:NADP-dependent oxidoreductase [Actinoallomurus sp. CA-150999]|uniref:NADP-dependent oxidoreductase n=1 Tax=Actinoallomurus sp. CA-150999 TaxID=3239887 RepID=UPI003D8A8416